MLGSTPPSAIHFEVANTSSRGAAPPEGAMSQVAPRLSGSMKRLTLDLPQELHRAIKLNAVQEGVTMAQKLRGLLMEHYKLNEPQPKPE
jgi:hypothetical protein